MTNPFLCSGPTIINVSGGRTSAFMLRRILDAHDGVLPPDCYAVFANTGRERPETLSFLAEIGRRWCPVIWIERDGKAPARRRFRVVTEETASRNGEPFDEVIKEHRFLPNGIARFCTRDLKVFTARDFMLSQGHTEWTSVMGLRFDEPQRVANIRARDHGAWDVAVPLYDARVTRADVMTFWASAPFDLGVESWESNCDGCYLKSSAALERTERDHPGSLTWWAEQEARTGARFKPRRTYLQLIQRAQAPMLGLIDGAEDDEPSLPCNCTD